MYKQLLKLCGCFIVGILVVLTTISPSASQAQDIPTPHFSLIFPENSVVGISPDASQILIVEPEGKVTLYATWGEELMTTQYEGERLKRIVWNPDNQHALLISYNTLYQADIATGEIQEVANFPDQTIIRAGYFYDSFQILVLVGRDIGSSYADRETYVLDGITYAEMLRIPVENECLLELPDDPVSQKYILFMRVHYFYICYSHLDWNPDLTRYMRWVWWNHAQATTIDIYEAETNEVLFQLRHCFAGEPETETCHLADLEEVAWSPDGSKIVSLPQFGEHLIKVWDSVTGDLLYSLTPLTSEMEFSSPSQAIFSDDGQQLMVVVDIGMVFVWDLASGDLIHELYFADSVMSGARWIYDNRLVIAWGSGNPWSDAIGAIWDSSSGEKLGIIASPGTGLQRVIEEPTRHILLMVYDNQIDVFDLTYLAEVWGLPVLD